MLFFSKFVAHNLLSCTLVKSVAESQHLLAVESFVNRETPRKLYSSGVGSTQPFEQNKKKLLEHVKYRTNMFNLENKEKPKTEEKYSTSYEQIIQP